MPTGDQYRQAAEELQTMGGEVPQSFAAVDKEWDDAIQGGELALTVAEAIDASRGLTTSIVGELEAISGECLRRAAICDAYDDDLRVYSAKLRDPDIDNSTLSYPPRPAPWVTETVRV